MGVNRARRNVGYGLSNALQNLAPQPIVSQRAPATNDIAEIGTIWIDQPNDKVYTLTQVSGGSATWSTTSAAGAVVTSLTVTGGTNDVDVDAGGTVTISSATINFDAAAGTTTITNDLDIGGDLGVTGTSTFDGDVVINGDFDINSSDAISFVATGDQDPAILLRTNGGTSETLQLICSQGTAADSIEVTSTAGGVEVNSAGLMSFVSSRNNAQAILLNASAGGIDITAAGAATEDIDIVNTAGSINLNSGEVIADSMVLTSAGGLDFTVAGTGGLDIDMVNSAGAVNISSGQAAADAIVLNASDGAGGVQIQAGSNGILIGNQADCAVIDVGDIVPTSARAITIGGGTVATAIADTIDIGPDGADTDAGASKVVNVNNGGVTLATLTTNIGAGAVTSGTHTVNIQSGNAAAGTVATNISTGTGTKTVNAGNADGNTTFNVEGDVNINPNADGDVDINGSTLGDVTIGNSSSGAVDIQSGAASNFTVTGATVDLTLSSVGGSVNITADEAAGDAIVIDASDAAGGVDVSAGTGGISLAAGGAVDIEPATNSAAAASQTLNALVGVATYTGLTTAMGASATLTLSNSNITTSTGVICQVSNLNASTNGAFLTIDGITQAAGSIVVSYTNNGAGALGAGDNVLLSFLVLVP